MQPIEQKPMDVKGIPSTSNVWIRSIGLVAIFLLIGAGAVLFQRLSPALPASPSNVAGSAEAVKIYTAGEGIVEVSEGELRTAGFPLQGLSDKDLRLLNRGRPVSLWLEGQGESRRLHFYGRANESLYSTENIYWLERSTGKGLELAPEELPALPAPDPLPVSARDNQAMPLPPEAYFAVHRTEQNHLYNPQVEAGDHWLWISLAAPRRQSFDIPLNAVADGAGQIGVMVWASTESSQSPDHHLVVRVNGQVVVEDRWDGKGRHFIEGKVAAGILREGENKVEVESPGDTGVTADITFLDWIEIGNSRRFIPQDDRLLFTSPGGRLKLSGFSNSAQVYDVTQPFSATLAMTGAPSSFDFDGETGHRYLAVGTKGYLRPTRLVKVTLSPDLREAGRRADYIAIGPPDLLEPLQPLLDWRVQNGLTVMAVPLDAIYDQFNAGQPEPQAIRAFLKFAYQNWQPAPRLVLLVGDGSYDPKGYIAPPEANRLPVFLIPTVFGGETASDVIFTQFDDGGPQSEHGQPMLGIGRIPARQPAQVASLVRKTLALEKSAPSAWQKNVLAIADGQDPLFRTEAESILSLFPKSYHTELLSPAAGATGVSQQINERLNAGVFLTAYVGHGSINMWGKDRLYSVDDVYSLSNGDQLPVVLNFTCLAGLFTHPKIESLAEAMLWHEGGGAVAILAPTSLTLATDQSFLSRPLILGMVQNPSTPLGELLLNARRQVPVSSSTSRDVMQTFLLLGDPGLRLAPVNSNK